MHELKRFLTELEFFDNKGNVIGKMEGPSLLAFSFKEAEEKIKIHNENSENKLRVYGQFIRDDNKGC